MTDSPNSIPPAYFDGPMLVEVLDTGSLIDALADAFRVLPIAPHRLPFQLDDGKVILMPSWRNESWFGVKVSTVFPGNRAAGRATVAGSYVLVSARDGSTRAFMDGRMLTLLRTAGASALASRHLSRGDARVLAMLGAGDLAPYLVRAHAFVRPIDTVLCWNRTPGPAVRLAARLSDAGFQTHVCDTCREAVSGADIVSAATLSESPFILGADVRPGTHLDLVGAFTPQMRECDAEAVSRARVFVDTREGARDEAGDLLRAVAEGRFCLDDIEADLHELVTGGVPGRQADNEITLFKSVGTAIEDLAAATLAYRRIIGID